MSGYEAFSKSITEISEGQTTDVVKSIDGYEINLRSMAHGYYLYGLIPVTLKNSEEDFQRHLKISMICFNNYDGSIALGSDNTLYASVYLPKPRSTEDLMSDIESLVNMIDVWVEMEKSV
ncbi:hypothetical protein TDB9533_00040 [Thalassocella blandensis]|nr:hypothetical protein TDB9533_00040 [Thalassocella blandensis]